MITQMTGQGEIEIFPAGDREFYPQDVEAQIVFEAAADGPAKGLTLNQDGQSWRGQRVGPAAAQGVKQ